MAWGAPKRNGRCQLCTAKGRCSCQRRNNADASANPSAQPRECTATCGRNGPGKPCRGTIRSNKCPCGYC